MVPASAQCVLAAAAEAIKMQQGTEMLRNPSMLAAELCSRAASRNIKQPANTEHRFGRKSPFGGKH